MKATHLLAAAGAVAAIGISFGAQAQCDPVPGALIGGGIGAAIGNAPGAAVGAILGSAITGSAPCYYDYGPRYAAPAPRYYDRGYYPAPAPAPSGYYQPAPTYYAPAPVYYAPPPVYYRSYPAYYGPAIVLGFGGYRHYRRYWR
ncbi:MAG: hypothetical protein ACM3X5_08945 [Bacillota bacterium]